MAKMLDTDFLDWAKEKGYSAQYVAENSDELKAQFKKENPKKKGRKGGNRLSDMLQEDEEQSERETTVSVTLMDATDGTVLKTLSGSNQSRAVNAARTWAYMEGKDLSDLRARFEKDQSIRTVFEEISGTVLAAD